MLYLCDILLLTKGGIQLLILGFQSQNLAPGLQQLFLLLQFVFLYLVLVFNDLFRHHIGDSGNQRRFHHSLFLFDKLDLFLFYLELVMQERFTVLRQARNLIFGVLMLGRAFLLFLERLLLFNLSVFFGELCILLSNLRIILFQLVCCLLEGRICVHSICLMLLQLRILVLKCLIRLGSMHLVLFKLRFHLGRQYPLLLELGVRFSSQCPLLLKLRVRLGRFSFALCKLRFHFS